MVKEKVVDFGYLEYCMQCNSRSKLVSQYAAVWSRAADEALPALGALEQLRHTPHLKYKIIFSVVVVSITDECDNYIKITFD